MNLKSLQTLAETGSIALSKHADDARREREISFSDIERTVRNFDVIEEYPKSYPHPALLLFGVSKHIPLHVVAGFDLNSSMIYIITVYRPDEKHFEADLRTRKHK